MWMNILSMKTQAEERYTSLKDELLCVIGRSRDHNHAGNAQTSNN